MAQRLATEYKNVTLILSKEELAEFIRLFRLNNAHIEERVLEIGDIEIIIFDQGEQVHLLFELQEGQYQLKGDCLFRDRRLADLMRSAMASYRGEAVVYRIFQSFVVEYCYEFGTIKSIREINNLEQNMIFENQDFSYILQKIFANKTVEKEIDQLRNSIDTLLDQRNHCKDSYDDKILQIDNDLNSHAQKLNRLEA